MEGTQLMNVRKFIKQTLNLSDSCKIEDFAVSMKDGKLIMSASISLVVNYEELEFLQHTKKVSEGSVSAPKLPEAKRKYAKRDWKKPAGAYNAQREFQCTPEDFNCIRVVLRGWRKAGKLNESEMEVMTQGAGKFFSGMTDADKKDFLSFFHLVRERLNNQKALAK